MSYFQHDYSLPNSQFPSSLSYPAYDYYDYENILEVDHMLPTVLTELTTFTNRSRRLSPSVQIIPKNVTLLFFDGSLNQNTAQLAVRISEQGRPYFHYALFVLSSVTNNQGWLDGLRANETFKATLTDQDCRVELLQLEQDILLNLTCSPGKPRVLVSLIKLKGSFNMVQVGLLDSCM